MVHVYCGDGKGKTTAAIGLAVRAAGYNLPVLFVQFLKDDSSSEINCLKQLKSVQLLHAQIDYGFVSNMTEEQFAQTKAYYTGMLHETENWLKQIFDVNKTKEVCGVVVFDEVIHALNSGLLAEESFLELIEKYEDSIEFVLTGRNPSDTIKSKADYISMIQKIKHPFDHGVVARKGIEY